MFLRDISMHCDHSLVEDYKGGFVGRFNGEATCISDLYISLLRRKVATADVAKLYILFGYFDGISGVENKTYGTGVLSIQSSFSFADYYHGSESEKKSLLHASLHRICMRVATARSWDLTPFESAYVEALRCGLTFQGLARQTWLSPNRKYCARIHVKHELDGVYLSCVLTKANSHVEITRQCLGKAISGTVTLRDVIGNGEWISPTVFELCDRSFGLTRWRADFTTTMANTRQREQT